MSNFNPQIGPGQNADQVQQGHFVQAPVQIHQQGQIGQVVQAPVQVQMGQVAQHAQHAPHWDGMNVVAGLKRVQVRELRQMLEALTGFEQCNKYVVKDESGEERFYALEKSNPCERNCYPADCAPWELFIYVIGAKGRHGDLVHWLTVTRPCTCTCLCANRPLAHVTEVATGELLGTIHDPFACCDLTFRVTDAAGNDVLTGKGGCCQWGMCCPCPCGPCKTIRVPVTDSENGVAVGDIEKTWMCGEACPICYKEQDNYWITFGEVQNPRWKALLLVLGIFLDFRYFSRRNQKDEN